MPLHRVRKPSPSDADVYATHSSATALPKFQIPEHGCEARAAFNLVRDELLLDGNSC